MKRELKSFLVLIALFLIPFISAENFSVSLEVASLGPEPTLTLVSPENITYSNNENILLNFTVGNQDYLWYNLDNTVNITINSSIRFNTTFAQHTLYLFATNSEGNTSRNVTFAVIASPSPPPGGGGGGGGGGSGGGGGGICQSTWSCTDWSNVEQQCGTRTCTDVNRCTVQINKPLEILNCPIQGVANQTSYCGDGVCSETEGTKICENDCNAIDDLKIDFGAIFWIGVITIASGISVVIIIVLREAMKVNAIKKLSSI